MKIKMEKATRNYTQILKRFSHTTNLMGHYLNTCSQMLFYPVYFLQKNWINWWLTNYYPYTFDGLDWILSTYL